MTLVVRGDLSEDDYAKAVADYEAIVKAHGEVKVEEWGKRTLAYPIQHLKEGYYALMSFNADPATIDEMQARLELDERVLRHMFVRLGTESATAVS